MALEESVDNENDIVEQVNSLQIVFEEKVLPHIKGKVLDYQREGAREGFALYDEDAGPDCGGCCG